IERLILLVRGERVMLDADLARLYGVSTKRFNEQVKRNRGRFPKRFMFQLTTQEKSRGGRKLRPPQETAALTHAKLILPASPDSPAESSSRKRLAHSAIRDRRLINMIKPE